MSLFGFGHVVVWTSECDVKAQAFDADTWGLPLGDEETVHDGSPSLCATRPEVAAMVDGSYQVVWEQYDVADPGGPRTIRGRRVSADGDALGSTIDISTETGTNTRPAVAATPANQFVVVWRHGTDAPDRSIRARRFADGGIFRSDFEVGDLTRWSAVASSFADDFNQLVLGRGITGDYALCTYDPFSGVYGYLGTAFDEVDGGLGGVPITDITTLYWKNEDLASTVFPYANEDADGDAAVNANDADALNAAVW